MKLIRVIQSKIVKKDNKYQVQSEKGKNLGTYDTKEQAEKRLKQVEMFKHMDKKASILTYANVFKPFIDDLTDNKLDWDVDNIDYEQITINIYDGDHNKATLNIDFELGSYHEAYKGTSSPYLADTPEDYYGEDAYYEDFFINKITLNQIGDTKVNIDIPVDSPFGKALYEGVEDYYKTDEQFTNKEPDFMDIYDRLNDR